MLHNNTKEPPSLLALYNMLRETHRNSPGTYGNWKSSQVYLQTYLNLNDTGGDPTLDIITPSWVEDYRNFLIERIPNCNTASAYFCKFKACLRYAVRHGWLAHIVLDTAGTIRTIETERSYLTLDELRRLTVTPCHNDSLRRAFLFACLTGLRKSDIVRLQWAQVVEENGFVRLIFRQKKTHGQEYLDITPQAASLLGPRGGVCERVFADFHYSSYTLHHLRRWTFEAAIDKHITFHSSRHTFAVLLLSLGTDLYTLQRLLGHHSIETTQVYAHIYDVQKREAVMRIPMILGVDAGT